MVIKSPKWLTRVAFLLEALEDPCFPSFLCLLERPKSRGPTAFQLCPCPHTSSVLTHLLVTGATRAVRLGFISPPQDKLNTICKVSLALRGKSSWV